MDATATFARFTGPHGVRHQPGLDGIRGLAVAAVVAFHLGADEMSGGYLGVSLFFTLSGVLIGTLILNEIVTTGRFSLPSFWRRRARRLLPPALITLAVVAVGRILTADLEATTRADVVASGLNVANWHFLAEESSYAELFGGPSAVLHFWSLAIEEQFYLVVGVLAVLLAGRARRPVRVVFVVAMATAVASFLVPIIAGAGVDRIYYGSDTRAGELMVGVAAAAVLVSARRRAVVLARARWLTVAATGALIATVVLWITATPGTEFLRRGLLPLTATCSLLLVVGALLPSGPVATIASIRPLRWLGGISYALYLVHWPVIVVANRLTDSRSLARSIVIVAISLSLAQLSAVAVERPVRRQHVAGRPLAFGAAAALAIVGVAAIANGRATQSAALLGGLSAAAANGDDHGDRVRRYRRTTRRHLRRLGWVLIGARPRQHHGDTAVRPCPVGGRSRVRNRPLAVAAGGSPRRLRRSSPAVRRQGCGARRLRGGDGLVPVGAAQTAASRSRGRAVRDRPPGVR